MKLPPWCKELPVLLPVPCAAPAHRCAPQKDASVKETQAPSYRPTASELPFLILGTFFVQLLFLTGSNPV